MKLHIYSIALLLSVLVTIVVWTVIRALLQPLGAATADIRRMATNDSALHELPVSQHDEVGELLASFNVLFRQRKRLQDELEKQARTDALTELFNRRHFLAIAGRELARATRYGSGLAVLMLDVDHFKKINDTYGHTTGDVVLKHLAEVCRRTLRETDVTARWGGEEFAMLLPEADGAHALELAERLRQAIAGAQIPLAEGLPLKVTVSIGVASLADAATNIDTLLYRADGALYEAKRQGRNRVCCWQ